MRGEKVMIDTDLTGLYRVATGTFNQSVRRYMLRFPADFMFQLTADETENLRSQIVISSWGGRRYLPFVFTEQGVAMLSSVLKSDRAIQVNMAITRAFCETARAARHSSAFCGDAKLSQAPHRLSGAGISTKMRKLQPLRH